MRRLHIILALELAGCQGQPAGQVAARVDGIEITDRELTAEGAILGLNPQRPEDRQQILDRLIDRTLLAQASEAELIDRTPAVQLAIRRARAEELERAYLARIAARTLPPSPQEIDTFIQAHPHRFGARTMFLVDRMSETGRIRLVLDSDSMSADAIRRLRNQMGNANSSTDKLVSSWPVNESEDVQYKRANTLLMQARIDRAVGEERKMLRRQAQIELRSK